MTGTMPDDAYRELESRFVTVRDDVRLGERWITLLRPRNADALISEADFVRDERLPYWADLWPSSRVLGDVLLNEPGDGLRLLELGCGLGFAASAALLAGYDVTATDYYDDALCFTRANAVVNTGREPATRMVNWRELPADLGLFDRVVAADVLYERPYATLVADAVERTLTPRGEAIIADPGRLAAGDFLDECRRRGFLVTTITRHWTDATVSQRISVHRLLRVSTAS